MLDLVSRHRAGKALGIASVCSAHPLVIRAALEHALRIGRPALIEATCNQVNQQGGYTGMRPGGFRDLVWKLADEAGLGRESVVLGGDHLGPNPWQAQPAAAALELARVMVVEYLYAGFRKIHLDCSMPCADDVRPLSEALIAERTALLCEHAERAWKEAGGEPPVYIIGSEVPSPGGAQEALHAIEVTRPEAARATLDAHRDAFARRKLEAAWERVIGLVVQPGVEFDDTRVIDYVPSKAEALSRYVALEPHLVFEAHSTDYQTPASLAALVRDHFAILKVGPALTFALREAVWALDHIEREWRGPERSSRVRETLLAEMRRDPRHWAKYYHGAGQALELQLEYSLSDRIRYYWPAAPVRDALARLAAAFAGASPPLPLLKQYLPAAYATARGRGRALSADGLIVQHIDQVLAEYSAACDP